MEISIPYAITLSAALIWTTVSPTGNRHLGILVCYASPPVFMLLSGFGSVATTWLAFSLFCSLICFCCGMFRGANGVIGIISLLSVPFDWPVLIPEMIESFLLPDSVY